MYICGPARFQVVNFYTKKYVYSNIFLQCPSRHLCLIIRILKLAPVIISSSSFLFSIHLVCETFSLFQFQATYQALYCHLLSPLIRYPETSSAKIPPPSLSFPFLPSPSAPYLLLYSILLYLHPKPIQFKPWPPKTFLLSLSSG